MVAAQGSYDDDLPLSNIRDQHGNLVPFASDAYFRRKLLEFEHMHIAREGDAASSRQLRRMHMRNQHGSGSIVALPLRLLPCRGGSLSLSRPGPRQSPSPVTWQLTLTMCNFDHAATCPYLPVHHGIAYQAIAAVRGKLFEQHDWIRCCTHGLNILASQVTDEPRLASRESLFYRSELRMATVHTCLSQMEFLHLFINPLCTWLSRQVLSRRQYL